MTQIHKTRVSILGGGIGALTTALALTDPENPRHADYDVTIYQIGWRLGGKGASGRNIERAYRIEEHGLHIWFGCYDNAFRWIRKVYAELGRAPDAPLASWTDAFKPHSAIVLKENVNGEWKNWIGALPTNDLIPGDDTTFLPLWDYAILAIDLMADMFRNSPHAQPSPTGDVDVHFGDDIDQWLDTLVGQSEGELLTLGDKLLTAAVRAARGVGKEADDFAQRLMRDRSVILQWIGKTLHELEEAVSGAEHFITHDVVIDLLTAFMHWMWQRIQPSLNDGDDETRRLWILLNFAYANIRGGVEHDIVTRGLDVLNDFEYRDFLIANSYNDGGLMANSSWVLGIYDAMFAYVNGDNTIPPGQSFPPNAKLEAGTVMRAGVRQFLAYKGASVWKMQAGMGDTIFAPIYTVLRRRGVNIQFFHRVKSVQPSADGKRIERIVIGQQATVRTGKYQPLLDVKGLPCWPSTPLYDQMVEGAALKQKGIDLESYCDDWPDIHELMLEVDKDFDIAVMGISLGALPYVACDLIRASPRWQGMVNNIPTIRTQAAQLWLRPTAYQLGWTPMQRPILTCYEVSPLNTWADRSHLVDRENWTVENYPLNLAYFCGPMQETPIVNGVCGPMPDCAAMDQATADAQVKATTLALLNQHITPQWPNAVADKGPNAQFDWDLLVAANDTGQRGASRFETQYWHANVKPSERYVLSTPGSSKHRLPSHDPDEFTNLYLAGDWTYNGFNLGCVEATTMSGLLASNAISGYPLKTDILALDL
jgi:uncharacterized protein with NAD-binding domain and iron-sulfur cluster